MSSPKLKFSDYILNLVKFMAITVVDTIPQMMGLIFFNLAGLSGKIGELGFLISSFYFFFSISYNHSEIINIKSGSYFSQGDWKNMNKNILQCIIVNFGFILFSIVCSFYC